MNNNEHRLTVKKLVPVLGCLALLLVLVMSASAMFGGPVKSMLGPVLMGELSETEMSILRIRIPRVLMGALAGGALGACGVILQALLRNPLAYPHILGISGGAAVGGIAAQLFGFSTFVFCGVLLPGGPMAAFATALLTTLLVYKAASFGRRMEPVSLILVGVVFNAFAAAMILFFFAMADLREGQKVLYWLVGSLDHIDLKLVGWVAAISGAGCLYMARITPALNVLSQGEEVASSIGVRVGMVRMTAFLGTSVVVGAVVSVCGMIGFVGLIIPHLLRLIFGPDHRLLYPAAFLGGACFLVTADFFARNVIFPRELPVGVLTAFCGAPFFLYLLRRSRGRSCF